MMMMMMMMNLKKKKEEEEEEEEAAAERIQHTSLPVIKPLYINTLNHYKCPLCDMTCPSPSGVRDHVRYRHSEERSYHCSHCDYKAKTAADLRNHLLTCTQSGETNGAQARKAKTLPLEENSNEATSEDEDEEQEEEEEEEEASSKLNQNIKKQIQLAEKENGTRHHKIRHTHLGERRGGDPPFQCHLCQKYYKRGSVLTLHLKEVHSYTWPSGHRRFRYKLHEDGFWRLQTVRLESVEVSEQLLGKKIRSRQGSDDDDSDDDSDDSQRLTIDESGKRGNRNAKAGPAKSSKTNSRTKKSGSQVETRSSPRKGRASAEHLSSNHPSLESQKDKNTDVSREGSSCEVQSETSLESEQEPGNDASRKNTRRRCKRKRIASEEEGADNCNTDSLCNHDRRRPGKKTKTIAQDPSPELGISTRSSPSKTANGKANGSDKSLILLAAAAAGLDTQSDQIKEDTDTQGKQLSMPSIDDFSSAQAVSHLGADGESQTDSDAVSSNKCYVELHSEDQSKDTQINHRKAKSSPVPSGGKKADSGRPVRKGRAMPTRFSTRRSNIFQELSQSSSTPVFRGSSATSRFSPKAAKDKELECERVDMSPAAASTISSSSAWMPPSVEGFESLVDESDAASACATPRYGTDTDFSEFNPDSPGSSTSVYAINPQYIQMMKERLQQQQRQQQQQCSQVSEVSGSETPAEPPEPPAASITSVLSSQNSDPVTGDLSHHQSSTSAESADPVISSTNSDLPREAPAAAFAHHREDTNDSWFALLTQAELCREEQQRQQLPESSPSQYAEVIVGSGSQLSSLAGVGACMVEQEAGHLVEPLQQQREQEDENQTYHHHHHLHIQQQQETQPYSTIVSPSTNTYTSTSMSTSPRKATTSSSLSPPKAMFPSPEKSFFTIGWELGAGVSPIKQEFKFLVPPEDVSRPSVKFDHSLERDSVVAEIELKCDEDAGLNFERDTANSSSTNKSSAGDSNSNNGSIAASSQVASAPNLGLESEEGRLETLQAVSNIASISTTVVSDPPVGTSLPAVTAEEGEKVVVLNDTGIVMCGDATDASAPQELYQVVEGPNGEYQIMGLTSADLYNFVDSEGRSVVFSQTADATGIDNSTDQVVTNCTDSSFVAVDKSTGLVLHGVETVQDGSGCISGTHNNSSQDVDKEGETTPCKIDTASGDTGLELTSQNMPCLNPQNSEVAVGSGNIQTEGDTIEGISSVDQTCAVVVELGAASLQSHNAYTCSIRKPGQVDYVETDSQGNLDSNVKDRGKVLGDLSTTSSSDDAETLNAEEVVSEPGGLRDTDSTTRQGQEDGETKEEGQASRNVNNNNSSEVNGANVRDDDEVDKKDDNNDDKDGSGLYNLQMLGDVALSSDGPVEASRDNTLQSTDEGTDELC
ncbi:histone H4 transcription factor [Elysia marginata]|uniref:Histone H4 transcription factor n=1 Tax=Elysia marginata TaxID=1093978 RepID=A0AAV4FWX1_9GAST|nr:histone H4 transcription factor [Elysia marginata]